MTVRVANSIDVEHPPSGQRLEIGSIAAEVGLSVKQMAEAAGISKTAMFDVVSENVWPARTSREQIEELLRELFRSKGATDEQIAKLFHGRVLQTTNVRPQPTMPERQKYYREVRSEPDHASRRTTKPPKTITTQETDVLLAKQVLSPEARRQFELFVNPFDGEVESADQMFQNGEIRFVREACWQSAINARFVGVTGESGAGKTTLLADLKERIATDRKPVIVIEPSVLGMEDSASHGSKLKATDILTAIAMTLDPLGSVAQTMERRTRQVERALSASTTAGNSHLVLIEEAHSLPIPTLKHLKRLHERMRLNGRKAMLGILLLGQPELRVKLDESRHDVREVVQRIELVELAPLGNDLKGYLSFRAKLVGREIGQLIDEGGIDAIRERLTVLRPGVRNQAVSLLYPLAVNNMATACLNHAAQIGAPVVTRDVVRSI